jgi:outer membrane protein assembly factor BamE
VTPYRPEVVQGNFVSSEQVQLLKVGLTRAQVKELLGTPLLTSVFRAERWEYVFDLKRQGVAPQGRKLTVFFKDDAVEKFTGDPMPTEAEFVASLVNLRKDIQAPPLEATPQALAAAPSAAAPANAAPAPELAPLPVSYPPLEGAATR